MYKYIYITMSSTGKPNNPIENSKPPSLEGVPPNPSAGNVISREPFGRARGSGG
jgi:hypothetical protein